MFLIEKFCKDKTEEPQLFILVISRPVSLLDEARTNDYKVVYSYVNLDSFVNKEVSDAEEQEALLEFFDLKTFSTWEEAYQEAYEYLDPSLQTEEWKLNKTLPDDFIANMKVIYIK